MFHSTRLKLTLWYVMIVMVISLLFSSALFYLLVDELQKFAQRQRNHFVHELQLSGGYTPVQVSREAMPWSDADLLEIRQRLFLYFFIINSGIFIFSGCLGYFLAGKTLRPIQMMVDEQNHFIMDASHELRTPLTALRSSIEVYLRDKDLTLSEARTVLESNLEEVDHLQALSDGLLELSQYHKPEALHMFQKISLETVLRDAIKTVTPIAMKKNIHIETQIEDVFILAEPQELKKLFVLLLENAVKYSLEGKDICVEAVLRDSACLISFIDHGVGIPEKDLPFIFKRFYRADASRSKENTPGYGLGLSIAEKIVGLHHGTVSVFETSSAGTTFVVKLPLHKSDVLSAHSQK